VEFALAISVIKALISKAGRLRVLMAAQTDAAISDELGGESGDDPRAMRIDHRSVLLAPSQAAQPVRDARHFNVISAG
jgi:hypothetical protein